MPIVRAERMRLRRTLATNLPIKWGKRVSRIVHDDHGVEAFFEDGTSAKGDILVGADGINSSGMISTALAITGSLLMDSSANPPLEEAWQRALEDCGLGCHRR